MSERARGLESALWSSMKVETVLTKSVILIQNPSVKKSHVFTHNIHTRLESVQRSAQILCI